MAASHFRNALHLFPMPESGVMPEVKCYSGFYEIGIDGVLDMIFDYIAKVKESGYFQYKRNEQSKYWMYESINEQLKNSFYFNSKLKEMTKEMEADVLGGKITSFVAAKRLLDEYFQTIEH